MLAQTHQLTDCVYTLTRLAPILRIRNYGETESMRQQCAIFIAELSLAHGMADLINDLDGPKLQLHQQR